MKSSPRKSGALKGSGRRWRPRRKNWRKESWGDILIKDWTRIRNEVPDFDPEREFSYSKHELILLAEKMLLEDPKPFREHPQVLLAPHWIERAKREVYVGNGVPDPSVMLGIYWRTHPQGRKVNSAFAREIHGAGFYR